MRNKVTNYLSSKGMYGTQSIFICFIGTISSASRWTELIPILSEGGKGDTTYSTRNYAKGGNKLSNMNINATCITKETIT